MGAGLPLGHQALEKEALQNNRQNVARTRNLRLTAIRSFFHYAACQEPAQSATIQRILAIPSKRQARPLVNFLTRPETVLRRGLYTLTG